MSRPWRETAATDRLGVRLPIVAAPMAGGPTTVGLVAAVAGAGALGVLAGGYRSADDLQRDIAAVRAATGEPFGVNLLVPAPEPAPMDPVGLASAAALYAPFARRFGLAWPPAFGPAAPEEFRAQLDVVLDARPALLSFTFGVPSRQAMAALRRAGIATMGTATTVGEAKALVAAGCDLVCAQGAEAGGHRGTFMGDPADAMTGLAVLLRRVVSEVGVPVVAAGGMMDGAGIAAALVGGAAAAQLGTAFLLCPEAGTSKPYRRAVAAAADESTVLTWALSGKPARGLRNQLTDALAGRAVPPYPVTNHLTRGLRQAAAEADDEQCLSLWAGQGVAAVRELPAAALVDLLARETDTALAGPAGAAPN